MTPAIRPPDAAVGGGATVQLIARLLAITDRFETGAGHLDNREQLNHLGACCQLRHWEGGERVPDGTGYRIVNQMLSGTCADSCVEFMAARAAARAYLEEHETKQLTLMDVAS